jgi:hypothetical protein
MKLTKQTVNLEKPELKKYCSLEKQLETRKNYIDLNGQFHLVHCYNCNQDNFPLAVKKGICAWCGWSEAKAGKVRR